MKEKIIPITVLRNTQELEKMVKESNDPIVVTKNGYGAFAILSNELYQERIQKEIRDPAIYYSGNKTIFNEKKALPEQDDPYGFVRVGCASFPLKIGNVNHNVEEIKKAVLEAEEKGVSILVFQELSICGYTIGDMLFQSNLHKYIIKGLQDLEKFSFGHDIFFVVGAPLIKNNNTYNCAIAFHNGKILGVVPKTHVPEYNEFYEKRYYASAHQENGEIFIGGKSYPFGTHYLFVNERYVNLKIGIEICEDAWAGDSPSIFASLAGATVILNLSASNEVVGKKEFREQLISVTSAKSICAYIYAAAGMGESTSDLVFAGNHIIAENGIILAEAEPFSGQSIYTEIDLEKLSIERTRTTSFDDHRSPDFEKIYFSMALEKPEHLYRHIPKNPFIPEDKNVDLNRVQMIIKTQAMGLVKRMQIVNQKKAVVGLSGGLDSTLALLVIAEAFKILGYDSKGITAITMPAFGTSKETHDNAVSLAKDLNVSFLEINITEAVKIHLRDIGHDEKNLNVTYENAQARERTQVLMDWANDNGALMVGTGDLSELCLGWCTYNGDHMSFYGVNASIPKTLVRYLCHGYALLHPETKDSLTKIIGTPISPELLPPEEGHIAQKTEDIIGPYELHDFFIYHFLRFGYHPKKLYFLAQEALGDEYSNAEIKKWLGVLLKRFFQNQFKRNTIPDGPKVGTVAVSPRGDLRLPSEGDSAIFMKEWEEIIE